MIQRFCDGCKNPIEPKALYQSVKTKVRNTCNLYGERRYVAGVRNVALDLCIDCAIDLHNALNEITSKG